MLPIDRLSIELSQRCSKACTFCYSHSSPAGDPGWAPADVLTLIDALLPAGLRFVSFGGGEPLEYPGLEGLLAATQGRLGRSLTTSGIGLAAALPMLVATGIEKVHLSVHHPEHPAEVERVLEGVHALTAAGILAGVNVLVSASRLAEATTTRRRLHEAGVGNDRIVYLPRRGGDTPGAQQMADVAGGRFQSMTCLAACGPSPRFVSVGWDRTVAWCSYTTTRRRLEALTAEGMVAALADLGLQPCHSAMRG